MQLSQAPGQLVLAFGADAGSSYINTIPVPSQIPTHPGAASYTDGFPPLTMTDVSAGGVPISGPDMNGILNEMSAVDVWMCAGGVFPYNSAFSAAIGGYPKGARVLMASGNGCWVSTVDNNVTDPDTGGAGWASADENAITALTGDVTATGPGSSAATLAASGVTAGSYSSANITVDAKGRITAASNGPTVTQADVTASRAFGTTYTAGSSPLTVCVSGSFTSGTGDSAVTATVNGVIVGYQTTASTITGYGPSITFIVPAGGTYSVTYTVISGSHTFSLGKWVEWTW